MEIKKLTDEKVFDNIYEKFSDIEKGWKKRTKEEQQEILDNFYVYKENNEILGGFSIKRFRDGYLLETIFSEKKGIGKKIINFVVNKYKNIYAFSKNDSFFGFKKLEEKSESGANLFMNRFEK